MRIKEKYPRKLLVEGNDDQHVIWALCEKFNMPELFDVVDCGGISKLFDSIPVRFKQADIETIGIIIDADTDLKGRWQQIKSLLSGQGFNIPDDLSKEGFLQSNGKIKVGVWIMPKNDINGMLEDFISFLVPKDDKLLPFVDKTLDEVEINKLNKYRLEHKSKARIHTWLSWQEDPGTPMGLSITKRYLTTNNEYCESLISWLKRLFVD